MLPALYRHSRNPAPPLRVGLLLDSPALPKCFAEVVTHIVESDFARLALVVYNADARRSPAAPRPKRPFLNRVIDALTDSKRRRRLLFTLYERLDQRRAAASDDPLAPADCSTVLNQVESLTVTPIATRFVHRFPPETVELIRERRLDVLLRFGFNVLHGQILTAARYGVWSYHHGDNDRYRGGPAYFWEVCEGNPISGAVLQILNEQLDAGKVLYKGLFSTYPGFSQARNRVQPYWGASTFMIQKLRELHERGWEHIERAAAEPGPYLGRKKIYTAPSNAEMLCWLGPLLIRKSIRRALRRPAVQHWRLAIRTGRPPLPASSAAPGLAGFRWVESPKGRYYADPFLIQSSGKPWLFFEDFDYARQRGIISCAELRDGAPAEPAPVLERPYHLSYPCIFRDANELYMIPESAAGGAIELHRCVRFPDVWELRKELLRAPAVDTTVWIEDGRYWFFVTFQEPRGYATQLWLFSAASLTGEWTPHPANPISTDVRNSRGAGAIFRHAGKLFRPSQDCSRNYGYSFTLNEITALTPDRYEERPAVTAGPTWARGLIGTHTYSHLNGIEVIDGCVPLAARRV